MNTKSIDIQMDILDKRRERANDRYMDKLDRADALIGELCRDGKAIFYINLRPLSKGQTLEGKHHELTDYLIRNRYV